MKRTSFVPVAVVALMVVGLPSAVFAQSGNSLAQAFGGLTFGSSDFVGSSTSTNVGGAVHIGISPYIQIVGEGGRMSDIKPEVYELLDFTDVELRVPAWYAQGGVRVIASPDAGVRPYGEATAGVARLRTDFSGVSGLPGDIIDTTLGFLNRTEPMFGLGAGLVLGAGPVAVDVGYRYRHIRTSGLPSILNAENAYKVNEVRVGVGVRF